jgi:hypothetical protein
MIYKAPYQYIMFLMRADPLRGQVGGCCAREIEPFLGPMKWHRAVRRVPLDDQKSRMYRSPVSLLYLVQYYCITSVVDPDLDGSARILVG